MEPIQPLSMKGEKAMYLCEETMNALTVKKAGKIDTAYYTIFHYLEKKHPALFGRESEIEHGESYGIKKDAFPAGIYAARIEITSSGNEPKLYAHIVDKDRNPLYYCRIFDTSPAGYGKLAAAAGAIMETFNLYAYYNDL